MSEVGNWVRVAAVSEVPEGEMKAVEIGRTSVALFHLDDGSWHATDNVCTHAFAMLTDGWLDGCEIECPLHAGRFDVRNGRALCPPVDEPVRIFEVRIDGDAVLVRMEG